MVDMRIMTANLRDDTALGACGINTFEVASKVVEKKGAGTRAFVGLVFNKLVVALTHRDVPDNMMARYRTKSCGGDYTEVATPKEAVQAAVQILCVSRINAWEMQVLTPKRFMRVEFDKKNASFTARDACDLFTFVRASVYNDAIADREMRTAILVQPVLNVAASDIDEEATGLLDKMKTTWDNVMNPKPYPKQNVFGRGVVPIESGYLACYGNPVESAPVARAKAGKTEKKGAGPRAFVGKIENKLVVALTQRDVPDILTARYSNKSCGGDYTEVATPKEAFQAAVKILCESRLAVWEMEVLTRKRIINVVFNKKKVSFTARAAYDLSISMCASVCIDAIGDSDSIAAILVPVLNVAASDTDEEAHVILQNMKITWHNVMNPKPYADDTPGGNVSGDVVPIESTYLACYGKPIDREPKAEGDTNADDAEQPEVAADSNPPAAVAVSPSRTQKLLAFLGVSSFFEWLRKSPEPIEPERLPTTAIEVLEERIGTGGGVAVQAHGELLRRVKDESAATERRVGDLEREILILKERVARVVPLQAGGSRYN